MTTETTETKFKPGEIVWLTNADLVRMYCQLAVRVRILYPTTPEAYKVSNKGIEGVDEWLIEGYFTDDQLFSTEAAAEAKGRSFLPFLMQEETTRHRVRMAQYQVLT